MLRMAPMVIIKDERNEIKKEKKWMQHLNVNDPGWRTRRRVLDNDHLFVLVSQIFMYQNRSGIFSRALSVLMNHFTRGFQVDSMF
jgi:hypothetical protein